MAKVRFKKKVARPGVVLPKNPLGRRQVKAIDREYLERVAATGNEMLKAGILIPMPYGHTDENGVYPIPLLQGVNGSLVDAKEGGVPRWDQAVNSGFACSFEIDPEDGGLVVESEHEGEKENQESHAGRVGTTFRQTSPFISDWTDGSGKHWKDAPLHICLTNRGVQHNQEEFKLITDDGAPNQELISKQGLTSPELAIAMSIDLDSYMDKSLSDALALSADSDMEMLSQSISGISPEMTNKIKELLKTKLGLTLPDDTDTNNLGDRLVTILTNMETRKEGDDITQMPNGTDAIQTPMIMADDLTPETNPDDLVIANKRANFLLSAFLEAKKKSLANRISKMIKQGQVGRPKGDALLGQVNGLALSLDDFDGEQAPKTPLELALDMLEETDAIVDGDAEGQDAPEGAEIPNEAPDMQDGPEKEMSPEEVTAMYNSIGVGR